MSRRTIAAAVMATALWVNNSAAHAADPYMAGNSGSVTLDSGATIGADYLRGRLGGREPAILQIAPRIWSVVGRSIVNVYVLEGRTGLIVYDTGFNEAEGKAILADIRSFSDRPISAIIYSHTHYPHGAAVLAEGRDIPVIGHLSVNLTAKASGLGGSFPETMPVQVARANQQMGFELPDTGPNAGVGHRFKDPWGKKAFLPVTRAPQDGEEIMLDGVRFVFFTRNVADSESVTAWIPERRIALTNFYWPVAANLYTPRGDKFRDARSWIAGLKTLRELKPELLLPTHAEPVKGSAEIARRLEKFADFHQMLFDQSLRGILKGLGPDELRHFVKPLPSLADIPQGYGESLSWYPPALFNEAMGWFSGDAADLNPPPPDFVREQTIALMGGADAVLKAAAEAEAKKQWAWALHLVDMLYRTNPENGAYRAHKSRLLRLHADVTPSSIAHNFYVAQAMQLEGTVPRIERVYPAGLLQKTPVCALIDQYRIRLMPERTEGLRGTLIFRTAEGSCELIVRPGVAEFSEVTDPSVRAGKVIETSRDGVERMFRGEISMVNLVETIRSLTARDRASLFKLAAAFEQIQTGRNYGKFLSIN